MQSHEAIAVCVPVLDHWQLGLNGYRDFEFLAQLADDARINLFPRFAFPAGELPPTAPVVAGAALAGENSDRCALPDNHDSDADIDGLEWLCHGHFLPRTHAGFNAIRGVLHDPAAAS